MDRNHGSKKSKRILSEQLWCCCDCSSQAGMIVKSTTHCPECGHLFCSNCQTEVPSSKDTNRSSETTEIHINKLPKTKNAKTKTESTPVKDAKSGSRNTFPRGLFRTSKAATQEAFHESGGRKKRCTAPKTENSITKPTFACPFYKNDPTRYDVRINKKYRTCVGPSVPIDDVRRLKDHLQSVHGPLYCDRCSKIFESKKGLELLHHCKSCDGPATYFLEEGISSTQWKLIDTNLRDKGGLKGEAKERRDEVSWYKIWDILLPGRQRPENPLNTATTPSTCFVSASETLFSQFNQMIAQKVAEGLLPPDENVHQVYVQTLREAYSTCISLNTSQGNNNVWKTEATSQSLWKTDVPSYQSTSSFAISDFDTQSTLRDSYSYREGINLGAIKDITTFQEQESQQEQDIQGFVTFEACDDPYSVVPESTAAFAPTVWSPSSAVDPRTTLLSPSIDHDSAPSISIHSHDDLFDSCSGIAMYPDTDDREPSSHRAEAGHVERSPGTIDHDSGWHTNRNDTAISLGSDDDQDTSCELDTLFGS